MNLKKKNTRLNPETGTREHRESGATVVVVALMITMLVALAGFGIDVAHWYLVGTQQQEATDAAALAAATRIQSNSADATEAGTMAARQNGYTASATASIAVDPVLGADNQVRVTTQQTVRTYFASILGINTVTIRKKARAEFQSAVPMGNPKNGFGNDPVVNSPACTDIALACTPPNMWLVSEGQNEQKQSGDRYNTSGCSLTAFRCPNPGTNQEQRPDGNLFTMDVGPAAVQRATVFGKPLQVEMYDAMFTKIPDSTCTSGFSATDPNPKYKASPANGLSPYCSGEFYASAVTPADPNKTTGFITTVDVFEPSNNPSQPLTGVPVPSCSKQFGSAILGTSNTGDTQTLANLLAPTNVTPMAIQFRQTFHSWVTLCSIANPRLGKYTIQVRTNQLARPDYPLPFDPISKIGKYPSGRGYDGAGFNSYSLKATTSDGDGSDISVAARNRFVIFTNKPASATLPTTSEFYFTRLPQSAAGAAVTLSLFDVGDVNSGSVTMQLIGPPDSNLPSVGGVRVLGGNGASARETCMYTNSNTPLATPVPSTTCTFSGLANVATGATGPGASTGGNNQGSLVTVATRLPTNYTCNYASDFGCWVRLRLTFPAGTSPTDVTSWEARIERKLLRLMPDA